MSHYLLTIDETAGANPGGKQQRINTIEEPFGSIPALNKYIADRYGKPLTSKGRNKIYRDVGGVSKEVGFLYSYWNKDISHNSKSWFQTDWITVEYHEVSPVII